MLDLLLEEIGSVYDHFPHTSRKIFLVDEEFVGDSSSFSVTERALDVSSTLHAHGFRWETSARVDQVYRPDSDAEWHVERMRFWTALRKNGLDRCLFGIESGVDSILRRFNKKTTAAQNVYALRLLTACGIPIRCTYITFDQLMTMDELVESYLFQGRTDVLLKPIENPDFEELFAAIHDEDFIDRQKTGLPMYSQIPYMLVSMECLIGSPYLRRVEAAGLAGEVRTSMGRRNAVFQNPVIGLMSDCSQRWIDRNFSFDYTLKSMEKITSGEERMFVRRLRYLLKESSYRVLGEMLFLVMRNPLLQRASGDGLEVEPQSYQPEAAEASRDIFMKLMESLFGALVANIDSELNNSRSLLISDRRQVLLQQADRWRCRTSWELINA